MQTIWVSYIRVIACFMVVFLHSVAPLLYVFDELPLHYWLIGNVFDSFVRTCVPLFFMISGFLLLQKDEPLFLYFSKRLSKLFIPLIFWSLFFVFWRTNVEGYVELSLFDFYSMVLTPSYYHLWFLYALIGVYFVIPILRKVVVSASREILIYYCVLWFVAVALVPLVERVTGIESRVDLNSISGYLGYLVLGVVLGNKKVTKKDFLISLGLFFLTTSFTAVGTYFLTVNNGGNFEPYLYEYLAPNTIVAAGSAFCIIKYMVVEGRCWQQNRLKLVVKSIGDCTFGIYLIHPIFLYFLLRGDFGITLSAFSGNPLLYVPLTSLVVFTLSLIVVLAIRTLPIVKLITP